MGKGRRVGKGEEGKGREGGQRGGRYLGDIAQTMCQVAVVEVVFMVSRPPCPCVSAVVLLLCVERQHLFLFLVVGGGGSGISYPNPIQLQHLPNQLQTVQAVEHRDAPSVLCGLVVLDPEETASGRGEHCGPGGVAGGRHVF